MNQETHAGDHQHHHHRQRVGQEGKIDVRIGATNPHVGYEKLELILNRIRAQIQEDEQPHNEGGQDGAAGDRCDGALGKRRPEQGVNRATEQGKGHHEPQIADHQSPLPNLL